MTPWPPSSLGVSATDRLSTRGVRENNGHCMTSLHGGTDHTTGHTGLIMTSFGECLTCLIRSTDPVDLVDLSNELTLMTFNRAEYRIFLLCLAHFTYFQTRLVTTAGYLLRTKTVFSRPTSPKSMSRDITRYMP